MSSRDPLITLGQMREFAVRAQELCRESTYEMFVGDWRRTAALERLLECVGEAVKRLPADLRERYPAVPWRKVTGMRDYICHGYDSLDYRILWEVVELQVPLLLSTIDEMRASLVECAPKEQPGKT